MPVVADHPIERAAEDPIAIVGAGCRLPGGVIDLSGFWTLLEGSRDTVGQVPAERWDAAAWFDPDLDAPGKTPVTRASFLSDVACFDAPFFGISPREALRMDPAHRLLLEVCWEALENAAIAPSALVGTETGVFIGIGPSEYEAALPRATASAEIDAHGGLGTMPSVGAGRISYVLGLRGPCVAVDTAYSSSLVAVHLACQSLRSGECSTALAGGVSLMLSPSTLVWLSKTRALATDGRCKAFSAEADGFGRGEGCAVVVLKRLSGARADGDRILAVIRGSAINHDGASSGLTVPNGSSQEIVLKRALADAGCAASSVGYVEAHGTGTTLGDPIEIQALNAVYGLGRDVATPLLIGSVKTNLGHPEYASGITGLLKVVLALQHGQIPAHLHAQALNPRISWGDLRLTVTRARTPWPDWNTPRRAGVSSFGMSGTNAHVVLEEAPAATCSPPAPERPAELLVLSARTAAALDAHAARLRDHLETYPSQCLGDVAFSLATTRSAMEHRLAVAATSSEGLRAALDAAAQGQTPPGVVRGIADSSRGKLAFLFTGQGAQTLGMGRGLYDVWPAFREAFDLCVRLFNQELDRPLREVMWAEPASVDAALLDQTAFTQPALFTFEYALAALWRSWGIEPELVAGHSIGELVAACVAGVFSLEDAVFLVAARGRLMQALPAGGAMVSIAAPEADVAAAVAPHAASVSIAAVNGPDQVVIAGAGQPVHAIAAAMAARGARTKALHVSHAFHSPLMAPMLEAFGRVAESVSYRRPSIVLVSNLSGKAGTDEVSSPGYWVRHAREVVRFADGVKALHAAGAGTFVEVGPKSTLLGLVPACLPDARPALLASSRAGRDEPATVLEALGGLWAVGGLVSWAGLFPSGGRRVPLPTYPWQRERYWIDTKADDAARGDRRAPGAGHDEVEEGGAVRGGDRRSARLDHPPPESGRREKVEAAGDRPFRLEIDEPGVLDHLVLRVTERRAPGLGEVEIAVDAAGLSFNDVQLALGMVPDDLPGKPNPPLLLGGECAGRIVAVGEGVNGLVVGQPVIALSAGAFATHVTTSAALVLPRPQALSATEAAAMPVAYLTAWYALDRIARLQPGERVLIHAATGGVGLAAVQWAQHVGAEVHATAGTPEKRAHLESLGVRYVSDSRSDRFVADVRAWTGGEGVDVVLNSLSGELVDKSLNLLRSHGRFVELGKRDCYADNQLGLRPFLRNLSFSLVDLRGMMLERPARVRALFEELLGLIAAGVFTPPPIATLPIARVADAFRSMAQAQHLGKLVLTLGDPEVQIRIPTHAGAGPSTGDRDLLDRLASAAPAARAAALEAFLRTQVSQVLRTPEIKVGAEALFTRLGMDSLMAVELRNRIEASLKLKLSTTFLSTSPNIALLTQNLLDALATALSLERVAAENLRAGVQSDFVSSGADQDWEIIAL
ncbi:hypothetical protein BE04_23035 [Sorangium cellulosum]|uniref:Carrier domain-containing protein n=1 Tax=Sorangium cellulosum TaxID=56 RepID=A0A150P267_SORCE|nr:hypothetical protein BE04_23035 [Sorangium cellulosum]